MTSYFLSKFDIVKSNGNGKYQARCPAHDDKTASLTITLKNGSQFLLKCHAGCNNNDILKAVGLEKKDYWPYRTNKKEQFQSTDDIKKWAVAIYEYKNENNTPHILIARDEKKSFIQFRSVGGDRWEKGLKGTKPILYKLPELIEDIKREKEIYIVEGEKDVDNLRYLGLSSTTNSGGAGKWKACYSEFFKDAKVIILPDNDTSGERHCNLLIKELFNIAKEIKVVKLPNLPEKGDVSDWLQSGGTKEELMEIVKNTPHYIKDAIESNLPSVNEVLESNRRSKKKTKLETLLETEEYLKARYDFRSNKITNKIELSKKNENNWVELTDRLTSDLYMSLQKMDLNYSIESLRLLLISSDFSPEYNPLQEYFDALPEWNMERNYIKEFTDRFTLTDERERNIFEFCFKKWFIATLTGIYSREWCNHTIFIIIGEQGDGKTTILNKLIPSSLKRYLQIGGLDFSSKDAVIDMCSKFLINIDELEGFTKKDTDRLKSIITKKHFDVRLPYGHNSQKLEKCCSFMASTNRNSFLNDTTGSRRFLPFDIKSIDYSGEINIDGMFEQAKTLYLGGYPYFFTKEEILKINARNENFTSDSMEEQLLLQYYSPVAAELAKQISDVKQLEYSISFLTTTELGFDISAKIDNKIQVNDRFVKKLGAYLRKHGFTRVVKKQRYTWCVKNNTGKDIPKEEDLLRDENSPF